MLHLLETAFLYSLRLLYHQHAFVSIVGLGSLCVFFFVLQFKRGKELYFIPGVIGLLLFVATLLHVFVPGVVLNWVDQALVRFVRVNGDLHPVPLLEPIFSIFIGPAAHRRLWEEIALSFVGPYICWFLFYTLKDYKERGLGAFSLRLGELVTGEQRSRPLRSMSNELGSGDLANREQIAPWIRPHDPETDTALAITNVRGSEGIILKTGQLVIPRGERNRHLLNVAKTGSGKTSQFILPILYHDCLSKTRSTVVLDSKPEMWGKLAMMTRRLNPDKNIMLFNALDTARSLSWNILSKIQDDTDCKLIANTIIMATDNPSSKADSPFFRNNALSILNAVMVGLLEDQKEGKDVLSMPRIHQLVQSGMKGLGDWLEARPKAIRTSKTFVELARSGSQNADTIMSELSMRVAAWDLEAIRATTSLDELDLEKLILEPSLLVIELRESEIEMLRPLANVLIVEILRFLTKYAEKCPGRTLPRPVGLVIDEFASALGRLPDIHVKLNTLRSRNVSIVAAIQSTAQIKANYGDDADSVLAGFATKIFMPALDLTDSEWASKETGQMTIRFQTASKGSNKKIVEWFASKNDSTQEQVQQRAVLTPDEIGRPADNISTFFMPNTPVFQGFLTPFYKQPVMLKHLTQWDTEEHELRLRTAPIEYKEEELPAAASAAGGSGGGGGAAPGLPPGISNTAGWTDEQIENKYLESRKKLDWENTTGSARKWWEAFENENKTRKALVLRLAEELSTRNATITEFFLAYVYSNTDNIQANLHYLDYTRLKKEEEKRKREAAEQAKKAA